MSDTKAALRDASRRARRGMSVIDRARASAKCVARLVTLPEVATAASIALYAAMPDEADPFDAVDYLASRGVRVLLPRVRGEAIEFVALSDVEAMRSGFRGINEPTGPVDETPELDVVVVPGLAFDLRGGRLGQGGGHYDRLLSGLPKRTLRVGLSLHVQVVDEVPREDRDELIDVLVTDEGVWRMDPR